MARHVETRQRMKDVVETRPARVTLISDDSRYAGLLAKNLERRSFRVDVRLVGRIETGTAGVPRGFDHPTILLLDLGWFDQTRQEFYQALEWLCTATALPRVLLVDESWPEAWVRRFRAAEIIRKPFSMERLCTVMDGLASL